MIHLGHTLDRCSEIDASKVKRLKTIDDLDHPLFEELILDEQAFKRLSASENSTALKQWTERFAFGKPPAERTISKVEVLLQVWMK